MYIIVWVSLGRQRRAGCITATLSDGSDLMAEEMKGGIHHIIHSPTDIIILTANSVDYICE